MSTKLKLCPACGHQIAKAATTCPNCGKNMTSGPRLVLIAFVTVALVFVLGGGAYCTLIAAANRAMDGLQEKARGNAEVPAARLRELEERRLAEERDRYLEELQSNDPED